MERVEIPVKDELIREETTKDTKSPAEVEEKPEVKKKKKQSATQKLKNKIEQLEGELAESRDEFLRLLAEFDNFRRRRMADTAEASFNAEKNFMFDLLPILDDFERLLNDQKSDKDTLLKGAELVFNKMGKMMSDRGLKTMDSLGRNFDIEWHDALMTVETADEPPGKVVNVFEKGYLFKDKILRHAKVIVSKLPEPEANPDD